MKTKAIFLVIFCMVAVIFSSCSDVKDYEYVETVKIETIISNYHRGHSFNDLVYMKNNEVKTVKLASVEDKAFRLKEFRSGDEVLLYKSGSNYYIASEKITSESVDKENNSTMGFAGVLIVAFLVVIFIVRLALTR